MSKELIDKIKKEVLPGATDLSLTVAGEPFMTPKIRDFVELAKSCDVELQLNTNATLIKDSALLKDVLKQSSVLKISLDGHGETYEDIRHGALWSEVLDKVKLVVRVRNNLPKQEQPRLAICMVVMKRNLHQLVEMVELSHALGVDRFEATYITVMSDDMEHESPRLEPEIADAAVRAARARADELKFRAHLPPLMNGTTLSANQTANMSLVLSELKGVTKSRLNRLTNNVKSKLTHKRWSNQADGKIPCAFLRSGVFISVGGDVAPCPMPGRPVAGNLLKQPFDEIWNGKVLTSMRQGFISGTPHHCCAHCSQSPGRYVPSDPETSKPKNNSLPS